METTAKTTNQKSGTLRAAIIAMLLALAFVLVGPMRGALAEGAEQDPSVALSQEIQDIVVPTGNFGVGLMLEEVGAPSAAEPEVSEDIQQGDFTVQPGEADDPGIVSDEDAGGEDNKELAGGPTGTISAPGALAEPQGTAEDPFTKIDSLRGALSNSGTTPEEPVAFVLNLDTKNDPEAVESTLEIPANATVTINGGHLTRKSSYYSIFSVSKGATLNLRGVHLSGTPNSESLWMMSDLRAAIVNKGDLNIDEGTVIEGFKGDKGGAIEVLGGRVDMSGTIEGNRAWFGGGIYAEKGEVTIKGMIQKNNGDYEYGGDYGYGGGVFVGNRDIVWNMKTCDQGDPVTVTLDGATISGNEAQYGGGLAVIGSWANLTMENGEVSGNIARIGGGICLGYNGDDSESSRGKVGDIYLKSGSIRDNTALAGSGTGGGIYVHQGSGLELLDVAIVENGAKADLGTANGVGQIGGGVWFCPLGNGEFYATKGSLIASNGAGKVGDDVGSNANRSVLNYKSFVLPSRLYDGTRISWYEDMDRGAGSGSSGGSTAQAIQDIGTWLDDWMTGWKEESAIKQDLTPLGLKSGVDGTQALDHYKLVISGNEARYGGGIACNGKLTLGDAKAEAEGKTSLTVNKIWANGAAPEGAEVEVHLYNVTNNSEKFLETATLSDGNGWSYTFEGLPGDQEFKVREEAYEGYEATYDPSVKGFVTITNTPKTAEVAVNKVWADVDGQTIDAPVGAGVSVTLLQDGKAYGEPVTLNASSRWEHTFTELPVKGDDGDVYTYTVREDAVKGYESAVAQNEDGSFTITNTQIEPETTSLTVDKVWASAGGSPMSAPQGASVTVTLRQNGEVTDKTATLSEREGWTHTFENLPLADESGRDYAYDVVESAYSGYEANYATNADGSITITNTQNPPYTPPSNRPTTGSLVVEKTVTGSGDQTERFHFTVTLDRPLSGRYGDMTFEEGVAEFDLAHGQRATATGLPAGVRHTVTEDDYSDEGYEATKSGDEGTIVAGRANRASFVNHRGELGSLVVSKSVLGGDESLEGKTFTFTVTGPDGYETALTLADGESATLNDLAPGEYLVEEDDASAEGWEWSPVIDGDGVVEAGRASEVEVTNTYEQVPLGAKGSLTISKAIVGGGEAAASKTYTFHIEGPGYSHDISVTGASSVTLGDLEVGEYTVTEADAQIDGYAWTSQVSDGGKATIVPNDKAQVTVTNTYEPTTPTTPTEPTDPTDPNPTEPTEPSGDGTTDITDGNVPLAPAPGNPIPPATVPTTSSNVAVRRDSVSTSTSRTTTSGSVEPTTPSASSQPGTTAAATDDTVEIIDDGVPLAYLPKTGDQTSLASMAAIAIFGALGLAFGAKMLRGEDDK